jgi:hypothetical protein
MKKYLVFAVLSGVTAFFVARFGLVGTQSATSQSPGPQESSYAADSTNASRPPLVGLGDVRLRPETQVQTSTCSGLSADALVDALMPETPYPDRDAWRRFLEESGSAFDSVRTALWPTLFQLARAARVCYDRTGVAESAMAKIVPTLEVGPTRAELTRINLRELQGGNDATAAARQCLNEEVGAHLPAQTTNPGPLRWPLYRGVYPKILTLYFGPNLDLFTGVQRKN